MEAKQHPFSPARQLPAPEPISADEQQFIDRVTERIQRHGIPVHENGLRHVGVYLSGVAERLRRLAAQDGPEAEAEFLAALGDKA